MRELRDDQAEALVALRQSVANGNKRIVMAAPTGMGKKLIADALIKSARDKGKRVLFTVPAIALVDQTVEVLFSQGIIDIGVIQANHHMTDWSNLFRWRRSKRCRSVICPADAVIIDNAQVVSFYERWLSKIKCPIGVTCHS
jgi:primosomal protein N'